MPVGQRARYIAEAIRLPRLELLLNTPSPPRIDGRSNIAQGVEIVDIRES